MATGKKATISFSDGTIGFFIGILKKNFFSFIIGSYLEKLLLVVKFLKKDLTILSSNE